MSENIARESRLHTDESRLYPASRQQFDAHKTVKHSIEEYVRYEEGEKVHTNSAEGYFSIFKRGMRGIYQHCERSICIGTWPNTISDTITALRSDSTTANVRRLP